MQTSIFGLVAPAALMPASATFISLVLAAAGGRALSVAAAVVYAPERGGQRGNVRLTRDLTAERLHFFTSSFLSRLCASPARLPR